MSSPPAAATMPNATSARLVPTRSMMMPPMSSTINAAML
jgi:hypothetical protein